MIEASKRLIPALLLIASPLAKAECPSWMNDPSIPACPKSDNTILPDTFPAMAYVVSDFPYHTTDGLFSEQEFTAEFVEGVLKGAGERIPLIFMPVTNETMEHVKARIKEIAKSEGQRQKWEKALIQVPKADRYTWQQDYFKPFINPKTGMPVLRWVRDYNYAGYSLDAIAEKGESVCSKIKKGPSLPPEDEQDYSYGGEYSGGNIGALPGGLCLHGNNQPWKGFAEHYCGKRDNEVVISTDWLAIGHVDEIVSVVKKPGGRAPCDFAVVASSPDKAIELLKAEPDALFGAYYTRNSSIDRKKLAESRAYSESVGNLCNTVAEYRAKKQQREQIQSPESTVPAGAGRGASLPRWLLDSAWADSPAVPPIDCTKLTNRDVVEALSESDTGILNQLIQKKMVETKKTIQAKLKKRLPQCAIEIIDVPDLFYTFGFLVEKQGADPKAPIESRYELPLKASASILPGPANQVISGATAIYPHPQNDAFAKYLEKTYKSLGVTPNPIDSFDYAHVGAGNVHCSTNTFRFCRPN